MSLATTPSTAGTSGGTFLPWSAPLAWGAGLLLAGMGASAIVGEAAGIADRSVGAGLVALGLLALAWGGTCLSRGRTVAPRAVLGGTLMALVGLGALLAASGGRASVIGAAVATVLLVVTAALIAVEQRRHPAPATAPAASVRLAPLLIAAALVALVVTPALGAVQDAALLKGDGTLVVVDPHQGH